MSAETVVDDIIDAAKAIAQQTVAKAIGYADTAQTVATSVVDLGTIPGVTKPTPLVPDFPPTPDEAEDKFRTNFAELYNQLGPEFDARRDEFFATYFPKIDECLAEAVDGWLCSTIANGATGIPATVEYQIWERSRARELRDHARRDDELISQWAARGFSLPSGALFGAQQRAQQDLSEKIATHSRDAAIEAAKIQIETIKFAVQQGITLRLGALEAAARYLLSWLQTARLAVDYANATLSARTNFYNALSAYYGALIASERLIYDWGNDQRALTIKQQDAFVQLVNSNTTARVNAAIASANAVANLGAAAQAAQNSLAQLSNITTIEG